MSTDWEAAYRAARYACSRNGRWFEFSLDGSEPPPAALERPLTLITAWNPNSEERPRDWNLAANERLRAALDAAGAAWEPAWGGSLPGAEPAWREDGFAVYGWSREQARRWGQDFGQRALVWMDARAAGLLFCADGRFVACGLRRLGAGQGF